MLSPNLNAKPQKKIVLKVGRNQMLGVLNVNGITARPQTTAASL